MMRGAKQLTWKIFNAEEIKPTIIGEGLEAFNGIQITEDLTAQVHIAMGTRQMLFDESYATADIRQREFYAGTIVPDGRLICDALNSQVLTAAGYRIAVKSELLEVFQDDASAHAVAMGALAKAFEGASPEAVALAMSIVGLHLSDEQRDQLAAMGTQRAADRRTAAIVAQNEAGKQKLETQKESNKAILEKMKLDVEAMKDKPRTKPAELILDIYHSPPKVTILPTKINYYDPKAKKPDKGKAK
jgi:hypothetical protein